MILFTSCPKLLGIGAPQTGYCVYLMDHCWAKQHLHTLHSVFPESIGMPGSELFQPPGQLQGPIISFKISLTENMSFVFPWKRTITQDIHIGPRVSNGFSKHKNDMTLKPIVSLPWWVRKQDFYPFWKGENCNLLALASELWNGQKQQMWCHDTGTVKKGIWERMLWHMPRPVLFESKLQKHPVLLDEL